MGVEIAKITDTRLNSIAKQADANKDNKLSGDEYQIFAQEASKQGYDYKTIGDTLDMNAFERWWFDVDKVSTDGKDDGKLSFGERMEYLGKGFAGELVKQAAKHPIATAVTVAAGIGLTVITGGAALPVMAAAGAAIGAGTIGYGTYMTATAENDTEAKEGMIKIGQGLFALGASAVSAKPALNAASKAGVTSAKIAKDTNIAKATIQTFKTIPEALKMSAVNTKGNVLTWTTGTVHAHSNALQYGAEAYMSKANDVQAYRFNPNGTPEEILANNPGVFRGADGKYYLPNKWSPNEPYLIDTSKEQMIMLYGGDDMAVCDGAIFKGSYVNTSDFKANGALNYQDPTKLQYGQVVDVTKQAPGAFKVLPEGTKIQTLEGTRTVQKGEVVALDHAGNPYVTTPANVLKRNTGFTDRGLYKLAQVDYDAASLVKVKETMKSDLSFLPEELRPEAAKLIDKNTKLIHKKFRYYDKFVNKQINTEGIMENYTPEAYVSPDAKSYFWGDYKSLLKFDLLKNKGIDVEVMGADYHVPFLTEIKITENGVTKSFAPKEGLAWIDKKLGITK